MLKLIQPRHTISGLAVAGIPAQLFEMLPDRGRQLDGAGPIALADDRDLAAVAIGLYVDQ
jgi:hypothetical protein